MNTNQLASPGVFAAEQSSQAGASPSGLRANVGALLLAGSSLAIFIFQICGEWSLNPEYAYGWGVPFLGILLLWRRWRDLPAAEAASVPKWAWIAAILVLASWLPIRILREANMDWRLLEWVIALEACGSLLGIFYLVGGKPYVKHLAFPVLFLLLAVPWPTRLETLVVQKLTGCVVKGCVEALRWMDVAAWGAGNIIQLPSTSVGVEDACSGIRAFQGSIMCSLFLGEVFRLPVLRRITLLGLGGVLAIILNFGRTLLLALAALSKGVQGAEAWHDTAGIATLLICFAVLWLAGRLLRAKRTANVPAPAKLSRCNPISTAFALGCVTWLLAIEAANYLWFRAHESGQQAMTLVRVNPASRSMRSAAILERIRTILRYDDGSLYSMRPTDGSQWWVYSLVWRQGGVGSPLARYHSPEICLPAAGFRFVEKRREIRVEPLNLRFQVAEYDWFGKPVYVFTSYRSSGGQTLSRSFDEFDLDWRKRVDLARHGIRPGTQQVLETVISGMSSARTAEEAFLEFARRALTVPG